MSESGVEADESPQLAELAAALAKAQGQMKPASKSSTNPHYKSKYADLASIWDACRAPLSGNGLAVMQRVSSGVGEVVITTMLIHSSGQWVKDRCSFPVAFNTAQGYGSAITYGRRYALAALVGVAADDDDDGEGAGTVASNASSGQRTADLKQQLAANIAKKPPFTIHEQEPGSLSPWEKIIAVGKEYGLDETRIRSVTKGATNKSKPAELTDDDVKLVQAALRAVPQGDAQA